MIFDLFMELLNGLYKMIMESIFSPFREMMRFFIATPDALQQFEFIDILFGKMKVIGLSLLVLIVSWQLFKVMFSYFGFECEDPLKIGIRAIIFGFMINYSKDIAYFSLSIFNSMADMIWTAWGQGSASSATGTFESAITNLLFQPAHMTFSLVKSIMLLYLMIKFIKLVLKFAERLMITVLLLIAAPLALASGVSQVTTGYLSGWVKLFTGNMLIQMFQMTMFISLVIYVGSHPSIFDVVSFIFIVALVKVMEKLEDIFRDISVHVGVGRDMSSATRSIMTAVHTTRTITEVVKSIAK